MMTSDIESEQSASRFAKLFLISFLVLSACIFIWKRADIFPWIGSCQADGYSNESFMAYCHSSRYGDYEHRAFWQALEPELINNLRKADVLFLGNSRTQYAFSTKAVSQYFEASPLKHYVFGFGMGSQNLVPEKMAQKYTLSPSVLVINADPFFTDHLNNTSKSMLNESSISQWEYYAKGWLQKKQRDICQHSSEGLVHSALCTRKEETLYRQRKNGHWIVKYFRKNQHIPVSINNNQNLHVSVEKASKIAKRLAKQFKIKPECMILTITPRLSTPLAFAKELALALDVPGIFPYSDDLITIDKSHLDPQSAMRWSAEFLERASPIFKKCAQG
jgi:hypothetical protein